jgi:hypothetical protein
MEEGWAAARVTAAWVTALNLTVEDHVPVRQEFRRCRRWPSPFPVGSAQINRVVTSASLPSLAKYFSCREGWCKRLEIGAADAIGEGGDP